MSMANDDSVDTARGANTVEPHLAMHVRSSRVRLRREFSSVFVLLGSATAGETRELHMRCATPINGASR